jgi:hypothetical protein
MNKKHKKSTYFHYLFPVLQLEIQSNILNTKIKFLDEYLNHLL